MPTVVFVLMSLTATLLFVGLDLRSADFRASFTSDRLRRRRNIGYVVGNIVGMTGLGVTNAWLAAHIPALVHWDRLPVVVEVVACVVVAEGINWLSHWVKHVQPWLWNFHMQHHVGRHYNTTLTLHTHPVDVIVSGAGMSAVLLVLGFQPLAVDVFVVAYYVVNLYKHGHTVLSLGAVLDRVIVGPAYHRVHHTLDGRGNYGSVLTFYDVVFGTAVWPPADIYQRSVGVVDVSERDFLAEMMLPVRDALGVKP
jgi:sterol desaturase/sphingolipid hydroxylase (fatty acid hydroxylase superfamily)